MLQRSRAFRVNYRAGTPFYRVCLACRESLLRAGERFSCLEGPGGGKVYSALCASDYLVDSPAVFLPGNQLCLVVSWALGASFARAVTTGKYAPKPEVGYASAKAPDEFQGSGGLSTAVS
jgi:hypothetical protein